MDELIEMLRTILMDFGEVLDELFFFNGKYEFYLTEPNITEIVHVFVNDVLIEDLGGNYTFDSDENKVTISGITLNEGDIVKIKFKKNKFSSQELDSYIRQSFLYLAIGYKNFDVTDTNEIDPEPTSEEKKLIVLVASILAKPDYTEYRLPNVTVRYTKNMSLEEKINALINRYSILKGLWDYIELTAFGTTGQT